MEKQSLQKDMQQSEEEFRKQFDRNAPEFHNGDSRAVPVGGQRVPYSMPSMYPEGFDPNQPQQVIDYGEEYHKTEADRGVYQNFKKSLAGLGPVVEAFMRHDQIFKEKGDPTNEKHIKVHEESIAKEKQNLSVVQNILKAYIPQLENIDQQGQQLAVDLTKILEESNKKYENKQSLGEFNFKVKKLSTKAFSEAQKKLQKMKEIKKNYKKPENSSEPKIENQQPEAQKQSK